MAASVTVPLIIHTQEEITLEMVTVTHKVQVLP